MLRTLYRSLTQLVFAPPVLRRRVRTVLTTGETLEVRTLLTGYVVDTLDDVVADDGKLSLREAIEAANRNEAFSDAPAGSADQRDRISFNETLAGGTIMQQLGQYEITDGVVITGFEDARIVIDSTETRDRAFLIRTPDRVILQQLELTGSRASSAGGAMNIRRNADVSLRNLKIHNNAATAGGGIYAIGATLDIRDTSIENNVAYGSVNDLPVEGGGGINSHDTTLTTSNITINGNQTYNDCAGIAIRGGNVTLIKTQVSDNEVYRVYGSKTITVKGIGVSIDRSQNSLANVTVSSSQIHNNTHGAGPEWAIDLIKKQGCPSGYCLEIAVVGQTTILGAGIHIASGNRLSIISETSVSYNGQHRNIREEYRNNGATGAFEIKIYGGGIYSEAELMIDHSRISRNRASKNGGGLYLEFGFTTISNGSIVTRNHAENGRGGGIFNSGELNIDRSHIRHNSAGHAGGGIFNYQVADVPEGTVTGLLNLSNYSTVYHNASGNKGGGIFNRGELRVDRSYINYNDAAVDSDNIENTDASLFEALLSRLGNKFWEEFAGVKDF